MNNEPIAWLLFRDGEESYPQHTTSYKQMREWETYLGDNERIEPLYTHPVKELTETDLILILEVLIDSYDDTNRGFLEYEAMYKNSPMRKARIDGMKRMVDKHTHAIEMVKAILKKAQE